MCITFARPWMPCNSCFKISLYFVHLAQHHIMILKCMRHWDQCYWHWNLLYPDSETELKIAVVVCVRLCVCGFPFLLKSGREWSVNWKIMQMQLGGIQNGGKLRSEKVKYKERKLRFLLFFFFGSRCPPNVDSSEFRMCWKMTPVIRKMAGVGFVSAVEGCSLHCISLWAF